MNSRTRILRGVKVAAVAGTVAGLLRQTRMGGLISQEYVPSKEVIVRSFGEFVPEGASRIQGIYANMDVDSIIFRYAIPEQSAEGGEVLSRLAGSLTADGWTVDRPTDERLAVNRLEQYGELGMYSYEEARVVLRRDAGFVYVAWFQADARDSAKLEGGVEVRFGRETLLPRFEELAESLGTEFY